MDIVTKMIKAWRSRVDDREATAKLEKVDRSGRKLYSRWTSKFKSEPNKFAGAVKEWFVVWPTGEYRWSFRKKDLLSYLDL